MASNLHQHNQLLMLFAAYAKRLDKLYDDFVKRLIATLPLSEEEVWQKLVDNPLFLFDDLPYLKARLQHIFNDYVNNQVLCYKAGITDGVALAFSQDKINLGKYTILQDEAIKAARNAAVASFIANRMSRKEGLSLSDKVWNYSQLGKSEVEMGISNVIKDGLKAGTSAEELGRKVRQYLNNPTMMYRRYWVTVATAGGGKKKVARWYRRHIDEKTGKVTFKDEPLERVGMGVYRSARMNGYRLMRTEINMSYHKANASRWANEPFVYGIRVWLSPQHPKPDICDDLAGYFPKDFQFCGWHPSCWAANTSVYTSDGWKEFKDIKGNEKILSLNPTTRNLEWVDIVAQQKYYKKEKLVHFYNRTLDCLVTKEHRMVYVTKAGNISTCEAESYRKTQGGFYRNSRYDAPDVESININGFHISFDDFCEFMGYYLSDGCISHRDGCNTIFLAQKEGEPAHKGMCALLERLGYKYYIHKSTVTFTSKEWKDYLIQFGKCNEKYIPSEILAASPRQIKIFLDAFIVCDGHKRKCKSYITKDNTLFIPRKEERVYFTTSKRLADGIGEAILKVGNHPSYHFENVKQLNKRKHVVNGREVHANFGIYRIAECYREIAELFYKEYVNYEGFVYDITLSKNHIMYIQRNGTCFWGSNCMCASAPLTLWGDEKRDFYRRLMKGEDMSNFHSKYEITEENMNPNWKAYIEQQHDAILRAGERGKLAYHLRDNQKYWIGQFSKEEQKKMGLLPDKKTIKEIAAERHAARTPEQAKALTDWWHEHKRVDALVRQAVATVADIKEYPMSGLKTAVAEKAIANRDAAYLEAWLGNKMLAKKLAYEKLITPKELRWSSFRKMFEAEKDASWVQAKMEAIVTVARKENTIKGAIDKLRDLTESEIKKNFFDDEVRELKAIRMLLTREEQRIRDLYTFNALSHNLDTAIKLINTNADAIGGALKRLSFSASDFYLGDIEAMRKLVNEDLFTPYTRLFKLNDAKKYVSASKSPILHQLYDGVINAYKTQGLNADVDDMLDKLSWNIDRLRKVAAKKMPIYQKSSFATAYEQHATAWTETSNVKYLREEERTLQNGKKYKCKIYETKGGTIIVAPKSLPKTYHLTVEDIADALEQLPLELKAQAKEIHLLNFYNPDDKLWQKVYSGFTHSYATGGTGTIRFYKSPGMARTDAVADLPRVLSHENGHNIDHRIGQLLSKIDISATKEWKDAMAADLKASGMKSPTTYGENALTEDFAESCHYLVVHRKYFEKYFPHRYKILKRILGV